MVVQVQLDRLDQQVQQDHLPQLTAQIQQQQELITPFSSAQQVQQRHLMSEQLQRHSHLMQAQVIWLLQVTSQRIQMKDSKKI
jgi:hypothetical protein